MKNTKKIVAMALAVIMVFGVATTAFAGESVEYDGKCYNNFYAENTLTKINDIYLKNRADFAMLVSDGSGALYDSKMYIAGVARSTKVDMGPTTQHIYHDPNRLYTGTCRLQIINNSYNLGNQIRVCGTFSVYS